MNSLFRYNLAKRISHGFQVMLIEKETEFISDIDSITEALEEVKPCLLVLI